MDTLKIYNLTFETFLGIHEWEQTSRQNVVVNLDLIIDADILAKEDNIEQAINYDEVIAMLKTFLYDRHTQLLETLTQQMAELVMTHKNVQQLRIQVIKPQALTQGQVSVSIERSNV